MSARIAIALAVLLASPFAHAGQTGAFEEVRHRTWACGSEDVMADVMSKKTAKAMKETALVHGCVMLEIGTRIWVNGGNALIEFGGVQGFDSELHYPAAAVVE